VQGWKKVGDKQEEKEVWKLGKTKGRRRQNIGVNIVDQRSWQKWGERSEEGRRKKKDEERKEKTKEQTK